MLQVWILRHRGTSVPWMWNSCDQWSVNLLSFFIWLANPHSLKNGHGACVICCTLAPLHRLCSYGNDERTPWHLKILFMFQLCHWCGAAAGGSGSEISTVQTISVARSSTAMKLIQNGFLFQRTCSLEKINSRELLPAAVSTVYECKSLWMKPSAKWNVM